VFPEKHLVSITASATVGYFGVHARLLPEVLGPPLAGAGKANAMIQAAYHFNKSCFAVVIEEVVWL